MASSLELTKVEAELQSLLLDVGGWVDSNITIRFTGGWVRDKLLGVPSNDIDVAISTMTGEQFGLKIIEYLDIPGNADKYDLGPGAKENGRILPGLHKILANPEKSKNLETATTKLMGLDIDLVNLRKETYNEISRNPQMEFGTPEEDAMRRDATVNAMFYNLNTSQIEDFTGHGFEDMEAKLIRTPLEPYQTFKDDPLRVLRLIRFASRLNYRIDPATETAMSNEEIREVLKIKISRERVGIELEKMLKGPDPLRALSLIDSLGLYETIFTDPTRDMKSSPELEYFSSAYRFVNEALQETSTAIPESIKGTLTRTPEEKYLAWICAAVMPWADAPTVPHEKKSRPPYYAAYLVAREGFKAPNKVSDVVATSLQNGERIRELVDKCATQLRQSTAKTAREDATAPDTLGMAIRRWGPTWRTQVLFSLIYEVVLGSISRDRKYEYSHQGILSLTMHRSAPVVLHLSLPRHQARPSGSRHLQTTPHRHRARKSAQH
jgi:tRNA nucleotidyltransferase/poly(A) polymerase